jgi:hypothetical protein
MNAWTDPHIDIVSGSQALAHCTAVVLTSTLLSALIVVIFLYGLAHMRGGRLRVLETLLGIALLLAAIEPFVEFFAPYWNSKSDQDAIDLVIRRAFSWHAIVSYVGCIGGLGLFCYLALTERPSPRRALLWIIAPALIVVTFMMFHSH